MCGRLDAWWCYRSNEQVENLPTELEFFFRINEYRVIRDRDVVASQPSYRIGEPTIEAPPSFDRIRIIAGEIIYNLRSSLGHLAQRTSEFWPRLEFPIYRTPKEYRSSGERKIKDRVSRHANTLIDDAQPYQDKGLGWSGKVPELNNIDKHHFRVAAGIGDLRGNRVATPIKGRTVSFSGSIRDKVEMESTLVFEISLKKSFDSCDSEFKFERDGLDHVRFLT